jgi:putative membrane protein
MKLLLRWLIVAVSLFAAASLVPGINVSGNGWIAVGVTAAILGLVNAIIRPILKFLSCGLIVVTLGIFTLFINGFTLWIAAWMSENWFAMGFSIDGYWPAFWGGIVVGIVSFLLSMFLIGENER